MRLVDAYCGTGGWSAGAIAAGCTPVLGIDCDNVPLQLWAANCAPAGRAACATLGTDEVDWPEAEPDVHVHLSPPCTSLSKARAGSAPAESVAAALDAVRWSVQLVLDRGYASWSLENVATPGVVACLRDLAQQHPTRVAFMVLDAADYGVPSSRVRLIASTPEAIRALKEVPVRRVSVAEAFSVAGVPLPSDWIKSNTTNRDGSPCVRSVRRHPARCPPHISSHRTLTHAAATPLRQVQQPSFTVTASHPLIWARRDGTTVRCLTVAESAVRCAPARAPPPSHSTTCGAVSLTREHAPRMPTQVLMGFAPGWKLPSGSRAGLRAVGNAVPPPLACAVMTAASGRAHAPEALPPPSPESPSTSSEEPPLPATTLAELQGSVRRIKRRLDELERRAEAAPVP